MDLEGMYSTDTSTETLVNECLKYALGAESYQETFDQLLSYVGNKFHCARTYIFEINKNNTFSNTYEWCAPGSTRQRELLQNEPMETIEWWLETFRDDRLVIIRELDSIRNDYPAAYAALKPQGIHSLVVSPLKSEGEIIGFLGIDDPGQEQIPIIVSFFKVMEYFVASLLKRRDLSYRLTYVSYHDQLTGALNRSAYKEKEKQLQGDVYVGIVYGDITGLKRENDLFGHAAGDRLICRCYELLCGEFGRELIYRMGGDEFMVICIDMERRMFEEKCHRLKEIISREDCHIAIGTSWGCLLETALTALIAKAEQEMYKNKSEYYEKINSMERKRGKIVVSERNTSYRPKSVEAAETLHQFLLQNPDGIGPLIDSTEMADSPICLYIGDLRTNIYYITDNMRKMFGFDSNLVYDLLTKWEKRICYTEDLESYRRDIENIWNKNQKEHDFKYRVYDKEGKLLWIHCRGRLYRDAEDNPRYFAGFVSRQEFLIDPITNLPRENAAVHKLEMLRKRGEHTIVVGIGLNHFMEINETKGRSAADNLLQELSIFWESRLSNKVWFYRLEGVSFMAVVKPDCPDTAEDLIMELRESVNYYFRKWNLLVNSPCSFCVFYYPSDIDTPELLVEKLISLIEIAKSNTQMDYISYSADTIDKYRENAGLVLRLNKDVLNNCCNFRIVIQPVVSAANGRVEGGEVLLRWRYMGKDVPAHVLIHLLEKKGLISRVGHWVFQETVRHCARITAVDRNFRLSFNVSYLQIMDDGFLPFMAETIRKYQISGQSLVMELTENHFNDQPERLLKFIDGCRALGMSIALDDFGSGYSSMGLLIKYPINVVKLDRTLLKGMTESWDKQAFLKAIILACHQFGKRVCVEGVENQEEERIVREMGSDMIQGYYFYRPLELGDFYRVFTI
ncbi:MAG: EAL domain-containing protein [Eubacteriales bacterium]|nr:EAL domain-containing protein [Eubacteriales bacterium]